MRAAVVNVHTPYRMQTSPYKLLQQFKPCQNSITGNDFYVAPGVSYLFITASFPFILVPLLHLLSKRKDTTYLNPRMFCKCTYLFYLMSIV